MSGEYQRERGLNIKRVRINKRILTRVAGWLARVILGGVFIFSGFVKGADPWGSFYKLSDYATAMGIGNVSDNALMGGSFLLFIIEFLIGVSIITGSFRRASVWCATAFMAVMLPLTAWIAVSNPVNDCGCFGDAFVISNWATFWKNVILTGLCVWLLICNRRLHWLVTPALQWIGAVASGLYILAIGLTGYLIQPLVDFRPYPVGENIIESSDASDSSSIQFIYEKDGERKSFGITDELPDDDSGWVFIERITNAADGSDKALALYDGDEEVTVDVITDEGPEFLLIMPRLNEVSILSSWSINSLYSYARHNNIPMVAAVSTDDEGLRAWRDISMAEYPLYMADDTSLKTVARGNPAVVYIDNGKVVWKSTLSALDNDRFADTSTIKPENLPTDTSSWLHNLTVMWVIVLAILILFSHIPLMIPKRKIITPQNVGDES